MAIHWLSLRGALPPPFSALWKSEANNFSRFIMTDVGFFRQLPQIYPEEEIGNQLSISPNLPITQHWFMLLNSCWVARVTKAVSVFLLFELLLKNICPASRASHSVSAHAVLWDIVILGHFLHSLHTAAIPKIAQLLPIFYTEEKWKKICAMNFDLGKQDHERPHNFF